MPKRRAKQNHATDPIRIQRNQAQPCSVVGCQNPRTGVSSLCRPHHKTRAAYGHPSGRNLSAAEKERYEPMIRVFLQCHAENPGVVAAKEFLADLIRVPRWYSSHPVVNEELAELAQTHPDIDKLLVRLASVWCLSRFEPGTLPDDDRLTFALARVVFFHRRRGSVRYWSHKHQKVITGGRPLKQRTSAMRALGRVIRKHLGLFLEGLVKAAMEKLHQDQARRKALREGLQESQKRPLESL